MAIAQRLSGSDKVFIRLSWDGVFSNEHTAAIGVVPLSVIWILEGVEGCQGGIALADFHFAAERVIMGAGKEQLAIVITAKESGDSVHSESLFFHQSFFVPFFDFARSERFPPFLAPCYEKPELLAIFTHVYNEDDMLTMWERHYSNLTPHRHLYVVDHGSAASPRAMFNGETNVVPIPRGTIDHANISGFCNYFQRFLLTQYKWVIHVDCDEFLVCEGGVESLLAKLAATDPGVIIRPRHAYDLIHDYRSEPPLVSSKPVSIQRSILKASPNYRKPVLGSVPATWMLGFHQVLEDYVTIEDDALWLIHLAFADLERNLVRQTKWRDSLKSQAAEMHVPEGGRAGSLTQLTSQFDMLLQSDVIEVPQWMRGIF